MNDEIKRIRLEYTRRDATGANKIYEYTNPSFVFHIQERERGTLRFLESAGIRLNASSVLEVGCGTGHILERFREFGALKVAGIDLMESRIKNGKTRYPDLDLVSGNAGQLPYRDGSFDLVTQFMCLSSVLDPLLRKNIAEEMWRVLRDGGSILSYDLRPPSNIVRLLSIPYYALRRIARMIRLKPRQQQRQTPESAHITPIKPLSLAEVRSLYPEGEWKWSTLSLRFDLCRVAEKCFLSALILSYLPFLRSHYLVLIRKTGSKAVS